MSFFKRHRKAPEAAQPVQYFTETGLPNPDFQRRRQEHATKEMYDSLSSAVKNAEAVYCPVNTCTGEPHIYMDCLKDAQGYGFTRARINLWTEDENERLSQKFAGTDIKAVRIESGENGNKIQEYLHHVFYENGVGFAAVNDAACLVAAEDILPGPDLSRIPEVQRPVTNPEVVRWQCLLAQLHNHESQLNGDLANMYLTRLGAALLSTKVLLPVLADSQDSILEAGAEFSVPAWKGQDGREYVRVFTDWRRLRLGMDPGKKWSAVTETASGLIGRYDILLNGSPSGDFGIYINRALYDMFVCNREQ